MNTPYTYDDQQKALADLEKFSKFFINEDRPLYLAAVGGWEIRMLPMGIIEAIALNGQIFYPKT